MTRRRASEQQRSPRRQPQAEPALQTTTGKQQGGVTGKGFLPGRSGNPGGRKRGTPNKATLAVRDACGAIVEDAIYRRQLLVRARAGELPPTVECLLWHYRYGKPKERLEIDGADGGPIVFQVVTNVPQVEPDHEP